MAVAAIVVATNLEADESQISETRRALANQSYPADFVVLAESIQAGLADLAAQFPDVTIDWIWPLSAGMQPVEGALAGLLEATEKSPSATWVVPKLVRKGNEREIEEYGLTVTRAWNPISPVSAELDQAQHDDKEDFLAATLLGSLIRTDALREAGFGPRKSNDLTNDFRLAIWMRLSGHRVHAAPNARVAVSSASVGHAAKTPLQLRKTQIELFASYTNPLFALLGGLLAPVAAVVYSLWLVLVKRPERIPSTLAAGFWWFGTSFAIVARRPKLSSAQRSGLKSLRVLFATREDIQRSIRAKVEQPAAIAEAETEASEQSAGFLASGGFWYMLLLAAVSWQLWPKDVAVSGGAALPLGDSLAQLFSHAGASWQRSGFGIAAPSDPFAWVLFALGLVTFWAPSFSVTLLLFLAKPLAFASAWRLLSLVTRRRGLITVGALAFAFWPALGAAAQQGRVGTVLALILLPLFVFTLSRILQFGSSPRRSVQAWTWVGTSALLAAVISASAPSLTPLLAVVILLLAIYRFKRIGYLIWLPVPLLVVWIPFGWYVAVGQAQPLALLTDPGAPMGAPKLSFLQILLGAGDSTLFAPWSGYLGAVILAIALFATLTRRSWTAMLLWLALLAAVASAWVFNNVCFIQQQLPGSSTAESANLGSPYALAGLAGLIAAVLLVIALDSAPKALFGLGASLSLLATASIAALFFLQSSSLSWGDGTSMPALVLAQAQQNPNTTVLELEPQPSTTDLQVAAATLVPGSGLHLQDVSTAYAAALSKVSKTDPRYGQLGQLAADLISANGTDVDKGLKKFGIDYLLVPNSGSAAMLGASLDTVSQLEPVGVTDFGRLYRVKSSKVTHRGTPWEWSITKQVQVAVLALFALLAIPTRRRAGAGSGSGQEDFDAFEAEFEGEGN